MLVCLPRIDSEPDTILLQHAATVCALGISQALLTIEHERRGGAELLVQILDGYFSPATIEERFAERGIDEATAVVVAARSTDGDALRDMHLQLWRSDTPHLTVHRTGLALSVVALSPSTGTSRPSGGDETRIGVSEPLGTPPASARRRRRRAGPRTPQKSDRWPEFDTPRPRRLLDLGHPTGSRRLRAPGTARSAQPPCPERDELMSTLSSFLEHDRSWQRTAQAMHVHRQTVLYRIRKVEQLTGLSATPADIATLWVAMRSWERQGY